MVQAERGIFLIMAIFDIERARREIGQAEEVHIGRKRIPVRELLPVVSMRRLVSYVGSDIRTRVLESGDTEDVIAAANAGLIVRSAAKILYGMGLSEHDREFLQAEVAEPVAKWFEEPRVRKVLQESGKTLHGGINWPIELAGQQLTEAFTWGDVQAREAAIDRISGYLDPLIEKSFRVTEQTAVLADAVAVLTIKGARLLYELEPERADAWMKQGGDLFEQAHRFITNPPRFETVKRWKEEYWQAREANRPLELVQPWQQRVAAGIWRWVFRVRPIERLVPSYA